MAPEDEEGEVDPFVGKQTDQHREMVDMDSLAVMTEEVCLLGPCFVAVVDRSVVCWRQCPDSSGNKGTIYKSDHVLSIRSKNWLAASALRTVRGPRLYRSTGLIHDQSRHGAGGLAFCRWDLQHTRKFLPSPLLPQG